MRKPWPLGAHNERCDLGSLAITDTELRGNLSVLRVLDTVIPGPEKQLYRFLFLVAWSPHCFAMTVTFSSKLASSALKILGVVLKSWFIWQQATLLWLITFLCFLLLSSLTSEYLFKCPARCVCMCVCPCVCVSH